MKLDRRTHAPQCDLGRRLSHLPSSYKMAAEGKRRPGGGARARGGALERPRLRCYHVQVKKEICDGTGLHV